MTHKFHHRRDPENGEIINALFCFVNVKIGEILNFSMLVGDTMK